MSVVQGSWRREFWDEQLSLLTVLSLTPQPYPMSGGYFWSAQSRTNAEALGSTWTSHPPPPPQLSVSHRLALVLSWHWQRQRLPHPTDLQQNLPHRPNRTTSVGGGRHSKRCFGDHDGHRCRGGQGPRHWTIRQGGVICICVFVFNPIPLLNCQSKLPILRFVF